MLDHVTLGVTDLASSIAFYDAVLTPLGITRLYADGETAVGYGVSALERAFFWLSQKPGPQGGAHIAFPATDRRMVERFYAAGLGAGGRDNGSPGIRLQYDPAYYAAFLLDPDGHNIEAVFRGG